MGKKDGSVGSGGKCFNEAQVRTIQGVLTYRAADIEEEANDYRLDLDGVAGIDAEGKRVMGRFPLLDEDTRADLQRSLEDLERELADINDVLTRIEGAEFR